MKNDLIKKNYLEKIKKIQKYNELYYNKSEPSVSDQKYDILKKESREITVSKKIIKKYNLG